MLAVNKQNRVQVLLSYSDEHKKHLTEQKEITCRALSGLVHDAIIKSKGNVTKTVALDKGFADLMIEGNISVDKDAKELFKKYLKDINISVGAEKLYVFTG